MKIIFDHQIFCQQRIGGISRYVCELATRLRKLTKGGTIIFAPFHVNLYINRSVAGVPVVGPFPNWKRFRRVSETLDCALTALLLNARRDIDIIHETYYSPKIRAPLNAKRIITVHDMIHEIMPNEFTKYDMTSKAKAQAVSRADHIICVSRNTQADLIRILGIPEDKTSIVYHGVAPLTLQTYESERQQTLAPFILYVGQRSGYKNFTKLVIAYAKSPILRGEFSLVCFGGGPMKICEMELIRRMGVPFNKILVLEGDDDDLARLYATASAFVYPSLYEGFGMPPLEAMQYGCPVVCTNTSSLPEVVGGAAEMFDPEDPYDIRRAIERVVYSNCRSRELIRLGLKRVESFSWDKAAQQTLCVYEKVMA